TTDSTTASSTTTKDSNTIIHLRSFHEMIERLRRKDGFKSHEMFQVEAQFYSYILPPHFVEGGHLFGSMDKLRTYATMVQCTSSSKFRVCEYRETFDNFMQVSADKYALQDGALVFN